jgi:hypothetical protein
MVVERGADMKKIIILITLLAMAGCTDENDSPDKY